MSIAVLQRLKELERRIEALEAQASAPRPPQVAVRTVPNAPSPPPMAEDWPDDDPLLADAPPRGLVRRRLK